MPKHEGKQPTPKVYYPRIPLDTRLMARVSMDIKEMPKSILGYTCILVCVCEYTNWVKAIPLVDQKCGTIADDIFFRIICEYGTPKAIICDEGPAFTSDLMKNVLSCYEHFVSEELAGWIGRLHIPGRLWTPCSPNHARISGVLYTVEPLCSTSLEAEAIHIRRRVSTTRNFKSVP